MTAVTSATRILRRRAVPVLGAVAVAIVAAVFWLGGVGSATVPVNLDMENTGEKGTPLNPATQSLNRYHSVLRDFEQVEVRLSDGSSRLTLELQSNGEGNGGEWVAANDLDITYLVPLLPYPMDGRFDSFDAANLLLGEYARNGVQLSYQESNTRFGAFYASSEVFDHQEEYLFENGQVQANPRVRPKRLSVTNNCLAPGLWEVAATDSVGEMYHAWFEMPRAHYFEMLRRANGLDASDAELEEALKYKPDLGPVPLDLDRLRTRREQLAGVEPLLALSKQIGGYSTQDSRRKVQKGYFKITRDDAPFSPAAFSDLRIGDVFEVHAFIPPGVYTLEDPQRIPYDPDWTWAEIFAVDPRTRYPEHEPSAGELGHVEILVYSADRQRVFAVGNVPVTLLVMQEDYSLPAFGVGVLQPSEPIERRYLRLRGGPAPHYVYLAERDGEGWRVMNNHEYGFEQVFLRPFEREGQLYLRFTLVAYERIVDLLELEIPIEGDLAERVREASRVYRPPLYRVYRDENIL